MKTTYKTYLFGVLFLAFACMACEKDGKDKVVAVECGSIVIGGGWIQSPGWLADKVVSMKMGKIYPWVYVVEHEGQDYIFLCNMPDSSMATGEQFFTCSGDSVEFGSDLYNALHESFSKGNRTRIWMQP